MVDVATICAAAPMIPVLTIDKVDDAVPLAKALIAGGLPVLEITLRTAAAREAMAAIVQACPEAIVGAGTLRTAADIDASLKAGAQFGVSPGVSPELLQAAEAAALPFLPGCATASEAMALAERGYKVLKFFPAEAAGGVPMLRSWAAPLPDIRFCPTGGIDQGNAPTYLALPNVITVGGSWVVPKSALQSGDWAKIEELASAATATKV